MRILILSNLYPDARQPTFGTFIAARARSLRQAGADVSVVAIRGHGAHENVVRKYLAFSAQSLLWTVRSLARRRPPAVVEAHIAYPTILVAWPLARLSSARLVAFAHGADVREVGRRSRLHRSLARAALRRADVVVANSPATRTALLADFNVPEERVVTWSPGVDGRLFRPAAPGDRDARQILYVGRLHPDKGVDVLIDAIGRCSHAGLTLRVVGDGPEQERLEDLAASVGVRATFEGALDSAGVAAAMGHAGVVVVPSRVREGLGLVALEAMATGALVVASAVGGLADTVVPGENGWLVPPNDAARLAAAIDEAVTLALQSSPEVSRIRELAAATAAGHDLESVAMLSLETYRRMIAGRPPMDAGDPHRG